jgi:hypothetical protein
VTFDCTSHPATVDKARHKFLSKCIGSEEKMKVIFISDVEGGRKLSSTSDVYIEKNR